MESGALDRLLRTAIEKTLEDLGWAQGPGIRAVMGRNVRGPRSTLAARGRRALDLEMDSLMGGTQTTGAGSGRPVTTTG